MMKVGEVRVADDQDFAGLKKLCDVHDGWSIAYSHPPTTVWTKPTNDSNFHMIKYHPQLALDLFRNWAGRDVSQVSTIYSDISGEVLYDVLHDPHYRHIWDKHMLHTVDIGFLNPNNDVSYYAISCPPPLKNRDFVLQRSWLDTGKECYILNHSVYHHHFPPQKGFVRAISHLTGYLVRPLPSGGCSFTYVSHSDPRGKLPPWLVNKLTHVLAPKTIKSLQKACKEYTAWKQMNKPHYKPWIFPEQIMLPRISVQQCAKTAADDIHPEKDGENGTIEAPTVSSQSENSKMSKKSSKEAKKRK